MNMKETTYAISNTYRNSEVVKNFDLSKETRLCPMIMPFQKCHDQITNQLQLRMVIQTTSKGKVSSSQVLSIGKKQ